MVRIGLLGWGRIGRMHASILAAHPEVGLAAVYDLFTSVAEEVGTSFGAPVMETAEQVFGSPDIDAVLIATPTPTHADYLEAAVRARKPAFCEKPIDLSLDRIRSCRKVVEGSGVAVQIGFNRRFDPGHRAAYEAMQQGEIGALQQVIITSRDPGLPPTEYLENAGGLFRDMTIHDFDTARFFLGEEPVELMAIGDALIDPELGAALNEIDIAMIVMRTESGRQCQKGKVRKGGERKEIRDKH